MRRRAAAGSSHGIVVRRSGRRRCVARQDARSGAADRVVPEVAAASRVAHGTATRDGEVVALVLGIKQTPPATEANCDARSYHGKRHGSVSCLGGSRGVGSDRDERYGAASSRRR